jgi:hypothetical protein
VLRAGLYLAVTQAFQFTCRLLSGLRSLRRLQRFAPYRSILFTISLSLWKLYRASVSLELQWCSLILPLNDKRMDSKHWLAMLQVRDVSTFRGSASHRHVLMNLFTTGSPVCDPSTKPVLKVCPRPFTSSWSTSNK